MVFVTRLIQPVQSTHIYGVEWDWTSSGPTKGTRTDDAAGFEDPNPAVNNGTGSSPSRSTVSATPTSRRRIIQRLGSV